MQIHARSSIPTASVVGVGLLLALSAVTVQPVGAQEHRHSMGDRPYADLVDREIKALSAEEIRQLEEGAGMQMALPAELNGYPGPSHVLELADVLELTPEQRASVDSVRASMLDRARDLGRRVIDAERALDRLFAERTVDEASVAEASSHVGALRAELRAAHLSAHLATRALLSEEQRMRYQHHRGYGGSPERDGS